MSTELYIDLGKLADLMKADGSTFGNITPSSAQRKREYDSSYESRPEGVAAGEGFDDSEEERDSDEDDKSITEVIEDARKIAKSLHKALPSPLEQEFMVQELGFPEDQVRKGMVTIPIRHRAMFQNWIGERLSGSVESLKKAL